MAQTPAPMSRLKPLIPFLSFEAHRGLAFGQDPRQRLDVYVPRNLQAAAPVLLFFPGGGWTGGQLGKYWALGQVFAAAGIVTVVAGYRLYPQVKYPAFVEDAAAALAWVRDHVPGYGGDPARLFVSGHSAGAYNAVMLASEPDFLAAKGGTFDWIRGVIGIAGPYDFLPLQEAHYIDMFHGRDNQDAMPVYHVTGPRPRMLLVTGTQDHTVSPENTTRMAARLRSVDSPVREFHYRGAGHVGILLSLLPGLRRTPLRRDMLDFIHAS